MASDVTLNDEPMYKRIRSTILERIADGTYPTGSMLPSENELAEEFGTTRLTVRGATDGLAAEGKIRRVQGKGAFVSCDWTKKRSAMGGFRKSVLAAGGHPEVRILAKGKRYAGPLFARIFGIAEDDLLYSVRRLNSADGIPASIEVTFIPLLLFPDIEEVDISVFSLYEAYEMFGRKPVKAQEKLDIESVGARDAGLLGIDPGDLVLLLECVSYDESGQAIEYAKSFNRGDAGGYTYVY